MMEIPFLDLKRLNAPYEAELKEAATAVVESGYFIRGNFVEAFEKSFAKYCGVNFCVGVGNGLDALTLLLKSYIVQKKLAPGDEILVSANTYIATILAITTAGLVPILVEPDETTSNINPKLLKQHLSLKTKAILVVHLYGKLCDMESIELFANEHELYLFEDAAQSHGAHIENRYAGSFGCGAGFSFYPTKNLGALGDAGLVATNDCETAKIIRALGNYGSTQKYINRYEGVNSRLDEMQAAFLLKKLAYLDSENQKRRTLAKRYIREIQNPLLKLPENPAIETSHVWHVFVLHTEKRNVLQEYLKKRGVGSLIFYPVPPHKQGAYAGKLLHGALPITEHLANTNLAIPMNPALTEEEVRYIISVLNEFRG